MTCLLWAGLAHAANLKIHGFENSKTIIAKGTTDGIIESQVLAIQSRTMGVGYTGFARVVSISGDYREKTVRLELVRNSQYHLVQPGDTLVPFDLSTASEEYRGTTELLVRERAPEISSRYKPLFTQGIAIGETAQSLWDNEFLLTWYGQLHFGLTDWLSIGTLVPGNFFNSPNASLKAKFVETSNNTMATGLTFGKVPDSNRWVFNWNLMWDSFTREKIVSHMFVTLAIYSIERAEDSTAIKSAGTSSIQTGHEYILDTWSRILFGPNYNFETQAIGGYLAYVKIWDQFHLQGTLYSTNVRNVKWSIQEGYFAYLDAYWRF